MSQLGNSNIYIYIYFGILKEYFKDIFNSNREILFLFLLYVLVLVCGFIFILSCLYHSHLVHILLTN